MRWGGLLAWRVENNRQRLFWKGTSIRHSVKMLDRAGLLLLDKYRIPHHHKEATTNCLIGQNKVGEQTHRAQAV